MKYTHEQIKEVIYQDILPFISLDGNSLEIKYIEDSSFGTIVYLDFDGSGDGTAIIRMVELIVQKDFGKKVKVVDAGHVTHL